VVSTSEPSTAALGRIIVSERAADLAAKLESANEAVIAALESCSEEQLGKTCEGEGWPVTVAAHHVATSHKGIAGLVMLIANGQPLPAITMEMIDAGNAQHARDFANVGREETLSLLRAEGKAAVEAVRGLTDEQLDRTAPMAFAGGAEWTAEQVIERVLIGHPVGHGESIQAASAS
jgi:hypothetical protein